MKENKLNPIIELWDLELKYFDANKAFKIIQIRTECKQLVQEQLLMFCKEQKIELNTATYTYADGTTYEELL